MKPTVAFFADRIDHWQAGTEGQMLILAHELVSKGWEVPLLLFRDSDESIKTEWPGKTQCLGIGKLLAPGSWLTAFRAASKLRASGVRVAHCWLNDTAILMPPVLRLAGLRVIVSRRDMGFWYTRAKLLALRLVRPFVDLVVVNSQAVATNVVKAEGYDRNKIEVVYNALAEEISEVESCRAVNGAVIGIVANIHPVKRLHDAIDAFAIVASQFPQAQLRLVGGGDSRSLRQLAASHGIDDRVDFVGQVATPAHEIRKFDVAVLPSQSEGLSNAIIEYMRAGKAVICTNTGGNPELIEHGQSGYLYPVGDTAALASFIAELITDSDTCRKFGRAAQDRVRRLCSNREMVNGHLQLYAGLGVVGQDGNIAANDMVANE